MDKTVWTALEGITVGNRYELQRLVATGGMAGVFRAVDLRLDRIVAVKVLRQFEDVDPTDNERFRREARATAALQSPYIVDVFDFFEEHGCYFLVMELVEGINLKQRIAQESPLAPTEALTVVAQVCRALQIAHDHGFIHRDIKPQNILLDPSGAIKLTDFGIVHISQSRSFTTSGIVLGTADYISPEQAQGLLLTPATDLYSLGVVLYEMLTGVMPFSGTTSIAVAMLHATALAPSPRQINPTIPIEVERFVVRALNKQPEQRFTSARAMGVSAQRLIERLTNSSEAADLVVTHATIGASESDSQDGDHMNEPERMSREPLEWRELADRLSQNASASDLFEDEGADEIWLDDESVGLEVTPQSPQLVASPGSLIAAERPFLAADRLIALLGIAALLVIGIVILHMH